mgnify:FL=1
MIAFYPLGENAVLAEFGTSINETVHKKVRAAARILDNHKQQWMIEYIPAFTTIAVYYDPMKCYAEIKGGNLLPYQFVCQTLQTLWSGLNPEKMSQSRTVDIPVCYGGEFGPDLAYVAKINGLTEEEVVQIHSSREYVVYMIGFSPGFPYLGGMSEKIAAPRKKTPRLAVPARSVGIAGMQTGIYPLESPGGWQIIGRTPLELFRPQKSEPSLLKAGDRVRFKPISVEEYLKWEEIEDDDDFRTRASNDHSGLGPVRFPKIRHHHERSRGSLFPPPGQPSRRK